MEIEKVDLIVDEEMTEEEKKMSHDMFHAVAPLVPAAVAIMQTINPEIYGAFFVSFYKDGRSAVVMGDHPPSVLIPVLEKVLQELKSPEKQRLESAMLRGTNKMN